MKTLSSILLSDVTFPLDIYFSTLAVVSRVPLFGHSIWSILLDSITDNPTFYLNLWFESLKVVIILRCMDLTYLYNLMVCFTIYFIFLDLTHQKFDKVEKEWNNIVLKNIRQCCCILIRMRRQTKIKKDIIEETHQKMDKVEKEGNNIVLKNIRKYCCILIRMRMQAKIKEDIVKGT